MVPDKPSLMHLLVFIVPSDNIKKETVLLATSSAVVELQAVGDKLIDKNEKNRELYEIRSYFDLATCSIDMCKLLDAYRKMNPHGTYEPMAPVERHICNSMFKWETIK